MIATQETLCVVMKCCLPSLLSMYAGTTTKDVCFAARVAIFSFFENLFRAKHADRTAVFMKLRPVMRVCFTEYIFYYVHNVTPVKIDDGISLQKQRFFIMNATNTAEQFRIELNQKFQEIIGECDMNTEISDGQILNVLTATVSYCQVLQERNVRLSRNHIGILSSVSTNKPSSRRTISCHKRANDATVCIPYLDMVPQTSNFCIFEFVCCRRGIPRQVVATLWDLQKRVRVHELSAEICNRQLQSLRRRGIVSPQNIKRSLTTLICLNCTTTGAFPSYRQDLRRNAFVCTRCDSPDLCVEVDILGRVLVINDVPLVFSTCCCEMVVYTGTQNEISDTDVACRHTKWSKNSSSCSFHNAINNIKFMQFIYDDSFPRKARAIKYISRAFVLARRQNDFSCTPCYSTQKTCAMCRSISQKTYFLVDIFSEAKFGMRVCSKHCIPAKWKEDSVFTLQKYLAIFDFLES